jgi:hypothetical protein
LLGLLAGLDIPSSGDIRLDGVSLTALNEGLADIWGWFYSGDPCFIERSIRHRLATKRCLNLDLDTLNLKTLGGFSSNFKSSWTIEEQNEQARADGYELGTNLARLLYQRILERGELEDTEKLKMWAKRIVEVLPTFLPHFNKVFIDDNMTKSEVQWERLVDTILFGPGSEPIPEGKCDSWLKTMKTDSDLENIKAKCKK